MAGLRGPPTLRIESTARGEYALRHVTGEDALGRGTSFFWHVGAERELVAISWAVDGPLPVPGRHPTAGGDNNRLRGGSSGALQVEG